MGLLDKMWNRFHVDIFIKAVRFGDEPQVISMLQREPDLAYIKDAKGISALFHAVANGYTRIAKQILRVTKQANDVDPEKGFTPLLIAATNGHIGLVKLLLEYGANPNIIHNSYSDRVNVYDQTTPLIEAVERGNYECVSMLIDYGADPNKFLINNDAIDSPLHHAVVKNDYKIVELLLSKVVSVKNLNKDNLLFAYANGFSEKYNT